MSLLDSIRPTTASAGTAAADATTRTPTVDQKHPGMGWWQAVAVGTAAAVLGNLLVFLIARAADASFVLVEGGEPWEITAGIVAAVTVQFLVIGYVLTALLALRWAGVLRVAQYVGGVFAVISVWAPLAADTDGGTKLALSVTHLVAGLAFVLSLEAARCRRTARAAA
ncbi:MAG TPA: DUF6069 family protein [Acidimicrobiales bacterium]|jgi:hypothetical protein